MFTMFTGNVVSLFSRKVVRLEESSLKPQSVYLLKRALERCGWLYRVCCEITDQRNTQRNLNNPVFLSTIKILVGHMILTPVTPVSKV